MRVFETKLHQFKISGITRNAKEKVGNDKPTPKLISAIYKKSAKTLELLFEVQSFSGKNKHSTMTGQMRELPSGYAVVLRFENLENPLRYRGLRVPRNRDQRTGLGTGRPAFAGDRTRGICGLQPAGEDHPPVCRDVDGCDRKSKLRIHLRKRAFTT